MERFIIGMHLKEDLIFKDPDEISHAIAGLQWGVRAILLTEIYRRAEEILPNDDVGLLPNYITPCHDVLNESIHSDNLLPYHTIQYWLSKTHSIARGSHGKARLTWTEDDTSMIYNDALISINRMGEMFLDLMKSVEDLTKQKLFCGRQFKFELPDVIHDDISNHSLGFSFLSDERNRCWTSDYDDIFARQYASSLVGPNRHIDEQGFLTPAARGWLNEVTDFKIQTGVLLKLTGGGCPRDTEMLSLQLDETPTGHRAFYFVKNEMIMVQNYDKMSYTRNQQAPIPRVVFQRLARVLVIYLMVIRPYEKVLRHKLCRDNESPVNESLENFKETKALYFVHELGKFAPKTLSNKVAELMLEYFGSRLTSRDLRHILHGIIVHTTPSEFLTRGSSNYGILSFNHSTEIGEKHYGVELKSFGILHPEEAIQFLNVCPLQCRLFLTNLSYRSLAICIHFGV